MYNKFYKISQSITGIDALKKSISDHFYDLLDEEYGKEFEFFLREFEDQDEKKSIDDRLFKILSVVLYLWYTGEFIERHEVEQFLNENQTFSKKEAVYSDPTAYYESLVWKTSKAHPPAITGGYFGYWKYKPEN